MITSHLIDIPSYFVDEGKRLRVSAFMELAQQIAEDNSEALGFGYNALIAKNDVWVLSRMQMRFTDMPRFKDKVRFESWHAGVEGPLFIRDYEMLSADGEPVVVANSSWAIMDIDSRAVQRPDRFDIPAESLGRPSSLASSPKKIRIPADAVLEGSFSHAVVYSDVDYNHHVNNTRYVVWAMDCLGDAVKGEVTEVNVNFNHEIAPGANAEILRYRAGNTYYVDIRENGTCAFLASFVMKP